MKKRLASILIVSLLLSAAFLFHASAAAPGDANNDGSITAEDARTALRCAVGLDEMDDALQAVLDVDHDDSVTAADARLILRAAVGLEELEEEEEPAGPCAHVWDEGEVTVAPTNEAAGLKTYTCTVCGETRNEKMRILDLDIPENNEYDMFRGQSFYITGEMLDGTSRIPMEIGVDGNVIYMLSEIDGVQLALQIIGRDLYIIIPSKGTYYKMDKTLLDMIGMSEDDLIPADQLNFSDMPSLWDADRVTEEVREGHTCKVYQFITDNGERIDVGMDGEKLIFTESYSPSGNLISGMYFSSVSSSMPGALKQPGAGNRRILTLTVFLTQMMDVLGLQ